MTEYTIKYEYMSHDNECPCCVYSERTITIYKNDRTDNAHISSFEEVCLWAINEKELREFVSEFHPEYNDFDVHPDTVWYF